MKGKTLRRLSALLFVVLTACVPLAALFNPVADISPFFTFDNSPSGITGQAWNREEGLQNDFWWETRQDIWSDAFARPAFMNLGFELDTDAVDMVVLVDFMQDIFVQMRDHGKLLTNVPFVGGGNLDLSFPRVGYIDFTTPSEAVYLSLGRRQIKWGPGTYGMALSDSQPYLDNLYLDIKSGISDRWNFGYDLVAIAYKHYFDVGIEAECAPQTTFAHRFSFGTDAFRIAFTELNNIYGKVPSLLDCTPIALWHNNYQDDCSNVIVDMALEGKIGPVRLFGSIAMDDFLLSGEPNSNPSAIGASAGLEWHALDGKAAEGKDFSNSRYAIKDETFHVPGGLNLSYEFYYCSTYMYNRAVKAGKFTSNFQINSNVGPKKFYDENAFFLGYKYGPGSMLHLVSATYETEKLEVSLGAQLLLRGSYFIDSPYDDAAKSAYDPFALPGDVTTVLTAKVSAAWFLQPGLELLGSLSFERDFTHGSSAFRAFAGVNIALCEVDWKSLF
ncbi:MAG: hypothetical protein IKR80_03960 [Spirochaetales bacterium]|nr:hypothetical protein [Spirochaetales bacterium]